MTVEQMQTVDSIGIDAAGRAVLIISDHLSWDDVKSHLFMLQEKLNAYLRFIESGEMIEKRPELAGREVSILVAMKFPIPNEANWFFDKASDVIGSAGLHLEVRTP